MIALFIAGILLSVIFKFFSQIIICEKKMQKAKEHILEINNIEVKLNSIFSQISFKNYSNEPFFYTENNSLFFQFDNGVDPIYNFCSVISAKLYLDKSHNLILQTKPLEKDSKIYREEIIAKNIKSLSFEFLSKIYDKAPDKKTFFEETFSWERPKKDIPISIKILINDKNFSFTFFLPSGQSGIKYYNLKK